MVPETEIQESQSDKGIPTFVSNPGIDMSRFGHSTGKDIPRSGTAQERSPPGNRILGPHQTRACLFLVFRQTRECRLRGRRSDPGMSGWVLQPNPGMPFRGLRSNPRMSCPRLRQTTRKIFERVAIGLATAVDACWGSSPPPPKKNTPKFSNTKCQHICISLLH